jgi:hypothetical protein
MRKWPHSSGTGAMHLEAWVFWIMKRKKERGETTRELQVMVFAPTLPRPFSSDSVMARDASLPLRALVRARLIPAQEM